MQAPVPLASPPLSSCCSAPASGPSFLSADTQVGGISKTINYRGNRMDLGGHRFFSKSDWVMNWWQALLPVAQDEQRDGASLELAYQGQQRDFAATTTAAPRTRKR